jgi:methionyl aminopeptidase
MPIIIKSDDEVAVMREAGQMLAEVLEMVAAEAKAGLRTAQLDTIVREEFKRRKVVPTFLGYQGYPAHVCVSVNEEIVHAIPGERVLLEGDIVSIDLGLTHRGFVADSALSIGIGDMPADRQRLIDVTHESLWAGIQAARAGNHVSDISNAVQLHAEAAGFSVVREYVGHGVGRDMHEEPQVPNYGPPGRGPLLRKGMVLAIEPMVNVGDWKTRKHNDGWTVSTLDNSLSAHFEHTIAITDGEPEVLTQRKSERVPVLAGTAAARRS